MRRVLVVDDDRELLKVVKQMIESEDVFVETAENSQKALELARREFFDVAVIDLKLEGGEDGLELSKKIKEVSPSTLIIIMTAYPSLDSAISALRLSVYDYIIKPFTPEQFRHALKRALEFAKLREENMLLEEQISRKYEFDEIKYASKAMQKVMELVRKVAPVDCDVLITGESGVGKELVARTIHKLSPRSSKRFVAVNCSAIPENLIESELFGYEKGAFTGATTSRQGLVEWANGGTLFLDEICEISPQVQVKLLRFLQERKIRRIGSNREIKVDVRVITATNRQIEKEVKEGRFREDLYWRINVIHIHIPPLRERKEDIRVLAEWYLKKYSREMGKKVKGFSPDAMAYLESYPWPGNVRELQNVIKRAVILTQNEIITPEDLPENILTHSSPPTETSNFFAERKRKIEEFERNYLEDVLRKFHGDTAKAQKFSGIPKSTFYRLLKKYNIDPARFK